MGPIFLSKQGEMMKKLFSFLFIVAALGYSVNAYAVAQSVNNASENFGDDGTPGDAAAGGATYTADNTLLTTADGQNFGTTAGVSITSGGDNQGTLTIAHTSTITGTIGLNAGADLKVLNAGAAGKTVTLSGV